MFEELFGNCPQSKVLDFFFSAPVDEYTKQQIAVGSDISRVTLDKFINKFIENEIIIYQNSRYILNTKSEFIRKLDIAQEEFIEFHFNKQLEGEIEENEDLSDEEIDRLLDEIPDYLDLDELEKEIEYREEMRVNKREYGFLLFSNRDSSGLDFSSTAGGKWYTMDVIE